MGNQLTRLHVKNFRSLADVSVETRPINVFFGPNGSGKSTLLEAIRLVKDCISRDVEEAVRTRHNGYGMLWQRVGQSIDEWKGISITLETVLAEYTLRLEFLRGQIQPYAGEVLYSKEKKVRLINRRTNSDEANFYNHEENSIVQTSLTFPEKLALMQYMQGQGHTPSAVFNLLNLLTFIHFYHSHYIGLHGLKHRGSESGMDISLREDGGNLWSVLRNIRDKSAIDSRYATIISFMRKSFPNFKDLVFDPAGPNAIYASFAQKNLQYPISALNESEGQLQMLILLTALFAQENENDMLILFDEPETSLHPYAISIFAEAVKQATKKWNKQVFIATHSPVLISQFDLEDILTTELEDSGQTVLTRVSEMKDIQDLLEDYATGSLYMAEAIAPQSAPYTQEKVE